MLFKGTLKSAFLLFILCIITFKVHAQIISTIDIPQNQDSKRSNLGVSYFMISSMPIFQLQKESSQSLSAYNFVSLNYRLSKETKFSFRPVFFWNTAGSNKYGDQITADSSLGDAHFVFSDYSIYRLEDEFVNLSGSYKLYIPTSDYSQLMKSYGQIRGEFYLEKKLATDESITYVTKPEIHFQSQKAFVDNSNPNFVSSKTTKAGAFEHYVEYKRDLNRTYSAKPLIGFKEEWFYGSAENNLNEDHRTEFRTGLGLEVRPVRKFNFTLSVENLTKLSSQKNGNKIAFFHPDNNSIVFLLYASL